MNQQQHKEQLHLIHKAQFYKGVASGYPTVPNISFALTTYLTEEFNTQEARNIKDYFKQFETGIIVTSTK